LQFLQPVENSLSSVMVDSADSQAVKPLTGRMPVLFVGHGSPMNAIEDNAWSRGFRALGGLLPRPKAILAVSAHWFVPGTFVTGNERPETIHDFGGFPRALYAMEYPAPGDVGLARQVVALLRLYRAAVRTNWGIDHGTWTVLVHLFPEAECPVIQLSIDTRLTPEVHLAIGQTLAALRDEGVLVMGSGNVTHNLPYAMRTLRTGDTATPPWAQAFDSDVARAAEQHDVDSLARLVDTENGRMCHPTLDHYLPVLYAAGAADGRDSVQFPITGFDLGSLSMRAILFGALPPAPTSARP
jgi:4,5-DOPA dioxygenase extradiol